MSSRLAPRKTSAGTKQEVVQKMALVLEMQRAETETAAGRMDRTPSERSDHTESTALHKPQTCWERSMIDAELQQVAILAPGAVSVASQRSLEQEQELGPELVEGAMKLLVLLASHQVAGFESQAPRVLRPRQDLRNHHSSPYYQTAQQLDRLHDYPA